MHTAPYVQSVKVARPLRCVGASAPPICYRRRCVSARAGVRGCKRHLSNTTRNVSVASIHEPLIFLPVLYRSCAVRLPSELVVVGCRSGGTVRRVRVRSAPPRVGRSPTQVEQKTTKQRRTPALSMVIHARFFYTLTASVGVRINSSGMHGGRHKNTSYIFVPLGSPPVHGRGTSARNGFRNFFQRTGKKPSKPPIKRQIRQPLDPSVGKGGKNAPPSVLQSGDVRLATPAHATPPFIFLSRLRPRLPLQSISNRQ